MRNTLIIYDENGEILVNTMENYYHPDALKNEATWMKLFCPNFTEVVVYDSEGAVRAKMGRTR